MVALISQNLGDVELDELVREGLTAEDWIFAAAVFVGSVVLAKVIERICPRVLLGGDMDAKLATLIARFIRNLIIVVGFIYALVILRVQIGPLLGVLGLLVVAVALAAQAIIENFFASVVLKTRRPFVAGEEILTNGAEGVVVDVNFRTVELTSYDGQKVSVPNRDVTRDTIVNHSHHGRRRSTVEVGVHYRASLPAAREALMGALRSVDDVLEQPEPEVWVTGFGESSIDYALLYWHQPDIHTLWRARSEVAMAAKAALDEAGIEIPFPQRTLTFGDDGADR